MLVLTRTVGRRIKLFVAGREIVVTLVDIRPGNQVQLGFDAPEDVTIVREELLERMRKSKKGGE
jgi:carbon storage regulator